jgi:NTP pyrophosphatase (non-canonical NTP hydrolase)
MKGSGDFSIGSDVWPGVSKFIEEVGEALQVFGKLVATGGELDHWDGTNLRTRIEDELADVYAAVKFVIDHNDIDEEYVLARADKKVRQFNEWHEAQKARAAAVRVPDARAELDVLRAVIDSRRGTSEYHRLLADIDAEKERRRG